MYGVTQGLEAEAVDRRGENTGVLGGGGVEGVGRWRPGQWGTHPGVVSKSWASQRAITIGAVLGEMRRIFKRSPRIVLGASSVSAMQARDLSLRSRVWPELDRRSLTPFPVGVATTAADLLRRLQGGAVGGR